MFHSVRVRLNPLQDARVVYLALCFWTKTLRHDMLLKNRLYPGSDNVILKGRTECNYACPCFLSPDYKGLVVKVDLVMDGSYLLS